MKPKSRHAESRYVRRERERANGTLNQWRDLPREQQRDGSIYVVSEPGQE